MMKQLFLGILIGLALGAGLAYYEIIRQFGGVEPLIQALERVKNNTADSECAPAQLQPEAPTDPAPETKPATDAPS